MPQMMPCSWLVVFLGSVFIFLLVCSMWSSFFFVSSFPSKGKSSISVAKKLTFWI